MTAYLVLDMITNAMVLLTAAIFIIGVGLFYCKEDIEKKAEEKERKKELLALTHHRAPSVSDLERVAENYPGTYSPEELVYMEGACWSSLDGMRSSVTAHIDELYELLDDEKNTEEQTEGIELSLAECRAVLAFLTFMQTHGVDAFLAHMQSDAFSLSGEGEDDD